MREVVVCYIVSRYHGNHDAFWDFVQKKWVGKGKGFDVNCVTGNRHEADRVMSGARCAGFVKPITVPCGKVIGDA